MAKKLCLKFGFLFLSAFLLLFCGTNQAKATIISDDILQYYSFDGAGSAVEYEYFHSTSTTYQLTKSENNGKTIDYIESAKFGGGVESTNNDGSSSNGACFYTNSLANKISGEFAYSVWYKTSNTNPYGHVFSNWENANARLDLRSGSDSYFAFYDGSSWRDFNVSAADKDGQWHNVVIQGTYGSLNTDSQTYVDGVLVSQNWGGPYSPSGSGHYEVLTIGGSSNVGASSYCNYAFLGQIDEFVAYNRKLTTDEISSLQSSSVADLLNPPTTNCAPGYQLIDDTCVLTDYSNAIYFFFDNPFTRSKNTTARIDYLYNQDVFTPYDYIEINRYDSATSTTKTFVATSTIIDLSYGGLLGKHDGQSFFTLTGTSTLSGLTYYGVKAHLAAYWSPILGDVPATTTVEYIVIVDWQDQTIPTPEEIINGQFQATSTTNIFNLDTYSLACTEDEWASTSSMPITGWNVDRTVCRIKKWVLDIGLTPAFWIQDKVKSAGRILGNTFPFGLVKQISKSWQDSNAQNLPSELTWLTPVDSNGDLYITIPAGLTGSGTSSKVVLFGDSIFKNGNAEVAAVFAHLRVISKYFLWFGFIWAVYRMGRNIYEELAE